MRKIIIYATITIILNVIGIVGGNYFNYVRDLVRETVILVSIPASKSLNTLQKFVNEYIALISVQKENEQLRKKLSEYEIICKTIENRQEYKQLSKNISEASFSFKSNFENTTIYLHTIENLDLKHNYCFVLTENLHLIGMVKKKMKNRLFKAITVFNPSFVSDVMIKDKDNNTFKALFIGNEYNPKVEFLDPNIKLHIGDKVYTSGDMGIFPANIYIGTIKNVHSVNGYYKIATININRSFFNRWKVIIFCKRKS